MLIFKLMIVALLAKAISSLLLLTEGFRLRELIQAMILMASPLTLLVAIATIGKNLGVIDDPMNAGVILFAVVSSLLYPTLFRWISRRPTPEH